MRIPRIYTEADLQPNQTVVLEHQTAHYLANVLRVSSGRELLLFNGSGGEFRATVDSVSKKQVVCRIGEFVDIDRESPLHIELAIVISKGDRMDLVMQKATELGVNAITPLFSERCEVKLKQDRLDKKISHWQQITISACEQSYRTRLPILHPPIALNQFLSQIDTGHEASLKLILHPAKDAEQPLSANKPDNVVLLIGPEGGFSDEEINLAVTKGFRRTIIGPRVLRTETAPIVALSVVQQLWGDFSLTN